MALFLNSFGWTGVGSGVIVGDKGFSFVFKNSNNVNVSQFLRGLQNLTSNTDPYQILEDCILYGVAAQTASLNVGQNWDAEIYVNGVLVPAATLNLNNVQQNRNAISVNLIAGDNISVRCNKIGVPNLLRPQIELFFKSNII